jgi:hypothetical protein
MITFLPTPDFAQSAAMLDSKRLGNQRVEARMILRWLRDPGAYPRHQNAGYTIMWRGYEGALCLYYNACCEEWARRGGRNVVCQPEAIPSHGGGGGGGGGAGLLLPPWLGDEAFHRTHRSALLHKLPGHYEKFGWGEEIPFPEVNYLWPRPVEGRTGEYELRPAGYWKVGKIPPTSKERSRTTRRAKEEEGSKLAGGFGVKVVTPEKGPRAHSWKYANREKEYQGRRRSPRLSSLILMSEARKIPPKTKERPKTTRRAKEEEGSKSAGGCGVKVVTPEKGPRAYSGKYTNREKEYQWRRRSPRLSSIITMSISAMLVVVPRSWIAFAYN